MWWMAKESATRQKNKTTSRKNSVIVFVSRIMTFDWFYTWKRIPVSENQIKKKELNLFFLNISRLINIIYIIYCYNFFVNIVTM